MARMDKGNQIGIALSDVPAAMSADDPTAQLSEAGGDPQIVPLLLPHVQAAEPQSACAPLLHRPCPNCKLQEEDWTRNVQFACTTNNGNDMFEVGRALFDTGANLDNLMSLDFVIQCKIHFEAGIQVRRTRLPWWKHAWSRIFWKRSQDTCYTVDQRPIKVIGVVENLRWRGIPEPRCNSGLSFPQKFLGGRFLVVQNLHYNAVFSSKTMNDAGLRGSCIRTVAVTQHPHPTQDPHAAKKSRDDKKEQKKIKQNQEQGKQNDEGKKKPSGD